MFKNYLTIAFRNLGKHPLFSFINIFGLALSMCIGLIVIMGLQEEFSYDRFHPHPQRTYRIISDVTNTQGNNFRVASTPLPIAANLAENNAFIVNTARIYPAWRGKVTNGIKKVTAGLAFTDPGYFDLFGFKLRLGTALTALDAPNQLVLSAATARLFYGTENPVGKTMNLEGLGNFLVTGVLEEAPGKSHIDYPLYCSMASVPTLEASGKLPSNLNDWKNLSGAYTYLLVQEGTSKRSLKKALEKLSANFKSSSPVDKSSISFDWQSITRIAPGEELGNSIGNGTTLGKVAAEITVAFVILLCACFNYTNLSIARSLKRAKEVGIRKVSGASRQQVFFQFISEAVVLSLFALLLAYMMMEFLKNYSGLRDEFFPAGVGINGPLVLYFLLFSLLTGLLAGVVPALTLSALKPVEMLKNSTRLKLFGREGLRKALIVFQFSISLIVIIFMLIFKKQFQYIATADYGFNREQIINIPLGEANYRLIKTELSGISGIERVSATSDQLGRSASGRVIVRQVAGDDGVQAHYFDIDEDFVDNMQLTLLAGRNFSPVDGKEEQRILVNEKLLSVFSLPSAQEAVGSTVLLNDSTPVLIAGVVKDFYFEGFENAISPMIFRSRPSQFRYLNIKTAVKEPAAAALIAGIKKVVEKSDPGQEFTYSWFDAEFSKSRGAQGSVSMLTLLAAMGLTIACLGLLGMVVYTVEARLKEVSIRKVLGAGVSTIALLLSRSFLKLVLMATVIAAPIGWLCGFFFLQVFAIRVSIGPGILFLACGTMVGLAMLVVGSQVFKVSNANPVIHLRTE